MLVMFCQILTQYVIKTSDSSANDLGNDKVLVHTGIPLYIAKFHKHNDVRHIYKEQ